MVAVGFLNSGSNDKYFRYGVDKFLELAADPIDIQGVRWSLIFHGEQDGKYLTSRARVTNFFRYVGVYGLCSACILQCFSLELREFLLAVDSNCER